jgi:hypothetical protein
MNDQKNKSTGPRSAEGKAISSKNAFKHGLASSQILIPGEDPEAFESLVEGFEEDHKPETVTEVVLVHDLAKFHWLKNRAIRLQEQAFLNPESIDTKFLELMMRYQNTNHRAFLNTLKALQAAQKERERQRKEFESQFVPEMLIDGQAFCEDRITPKGTRPGAGVRRTSHFHPSPRHAGLKKRFFTANIAPRPPRTLPIRQLTQYFQ